MQTYLPSPIFSDSAEMLDDRVLDRQREQTYRIMKSLFHGNTWAYNPASRMWRGYEWALLDYQKAIVAEWTARGYQDVYMPMTFDLFAGRPSRRTDLVPPWLGDKNFHYSQQAALIRQDPWYYCALFPGVPVDLSYIYPVKD